MPIETGVGAQNLPHAETTNHEAQNPTKELTIEKHANTIRESIKTHVNTLIISGTGSGKTTKGPQYINDVMEAGDKMICTQPRKINSESLAARVAQEMGETLGEKVGFKHGDDENYSREKSDIMFETDGLLLQQLKNDPELKGITHVMVDEAHVRSTNLESLLLGLKAAQKLRKEKGEKPLRLIVTSATIDKEEYVKYLGEVNTIEVEGAPNHPVAQYFETSPVPKGEMLQTAARKVGEIISSKKDGDIVVFVASVNDITKTEAEIKRLSIGNPQIIQLHSGSSEEQKSEVSKKATDGSRRIIIATNFAETGVTIDGLKHVVDTGEQFEETVDALSGLTHVSRKPISRADCLQRAGRVGRVEPGDYYALFTKGDFDSRNKYPTPEIQRTDLTDLLLYAKKFKIDLANADLLSAPLNKDRITHSEQTLKILGALNSDGTINAIGERMLALPTDFHFGRLIAEAEIQGRGVKEACTIAALAETIKLDDNTKKFGYKDSDFMSLLYVWSEWEMDGRSEEWARKNGINFKSLQAAVKKREKLLQYSKSVKSPAPSAGEIQKWLTKSFRDRLMTYDPNKNSYVLARNNEANIKIIIGKNSALAESVPEMVVSMSNLPIDEENRQNPIEINFVQAVNREWLEELAA